MKMKKNSISSMQPQPAALPPPLVGPASLRLSRSFLSSSLKALATASLSIFLPNDQVRSFGVYSIDSRAVPLAKSRLKVFWPRTTGQ
jgi:hypothetical protein